MTFMVCDISQRNTHTHKAVQGSSACRAVPSALASHGVGPVSGALGIWGTGAAQALLKEGRPGWGSHRLTLESQGPGPSAQSRIRRMGARGSERDPGSAEGPWPGERGSRGLFPEVFSSSSLGRRGFPGGRLQTRSWDSSLWSPATPRTAGNPALVSESTSRMMPHAAGSVMITVCAHVLFLCFLWEQLCWADLVWSLS